MLCDLISSVYYSETSKAIGQYPAESEWVVAFTMFDLPVIQLQPVKQLL